jgi:hypothetical protein
MWAAIWYYCSNRNRVEKEKDQKVCVLILGTYSVKRCENEKQGKVHGGRKMKG